LVQLRGYHRMFSSIFGSSSGGSSNSGIKSSDPFIPSVSSWENPDEGYFKPRPTLKNVGKFENMTDRANDIFDIEPQTFTGVQLNIQNVLHPNFVTFHSVAMGKKENIDPWTEKKR